MRARQISVAFLETEHESVGFARRLEQTDLLADVFETRQGATQLETVGARHVIGHRRRHDRGHRDAARKVLAALGAHARQIVHKQDAHLVARDQRVVVAVFAGHTHAVGIRVGRQQQVGGRALRRAFAAAGDAGFEGGALFGIGVFARGEIAVRLALPCHHVKVIDADAAQRVAHAFQARAAQRRVHNLKRTLHLLGRFLRLRQNRLDETLQRIVADLFHQPLGGRTVEIDRLRTGSVGFEIAQACDARRDVGRGLAGDLAAVGTIDFVAVVSGRIMARSHVDAGAAAQVAHGERKRGRGLDARIHQAADAVGGKHARGRAHEQLAFVARVARDGDAGVFEAGVEVLCQTLGGARHGVDVHAVGAGPDHAAQARRAEFKILEECIGDRSVVGLRKPRELCGKLVVRHAFAPVREGSAHVDFAHIPSPCRGRARERQNPPKAPRYDFPILPMTLGANQKTHDKETSAAASRRRRRPVPHASSKVPPMPKPRNARRPFGEGMGTPRRVAETFFNEGIDSGRRDAGQKKAHVSYKKTVCRQRLSICRLALRIH